MVAGRVVTRAGEVDGFGQPVQPSAPVPPQPLLIARWLWIGTTLVGAVHSFVQLFDREALIGQLQGLGQNLSQEELDTAANGEVMFAILLSALTIGCYLLLSNRMLEGRNWARVVLTILGGLNAVGTVLTLILVAALGTGLIRQLTGVPIETLDLISGGITLVMSIASR